MKSQVERAIRLFGEVVEVIYRDGDPTRSVSGSVQRPVSDSLVNDFDQDAFVVYIAIADLVKAPQKFDRLRVRGELRSVDSVQIETLKDEAICYMVRVRG